MFFHFSSSEVTFEEPRECAGTNKKLHRNDEGKFNTKCVKICNNHLSDITTLYKVLETNLNDPLAVSWIDLSWNELPTIDAVR